MIKHRVRMVIIKNDSLLLTYDNHNNYYYYIGGKVEFGETIKQACVREISEECQALFTFKKILYIREFINPQISEHSIEFFVWGDIDKYDEVDKLRDPQDLKNHWAQWVPLKLLNEIEIKPRTLTPILIQDYAAGFPRETVYLGAMK